MITAERIAPGFPLTELLAGWASAPVPAIDVTGLAIDSRRAQPGGLFLACAGSRLDGVQFIRDAVARGAAAVAVEPDRLDEALRTVNGAAAVVAIPGLMQRVGEIADRFFGHPSQAMRVVGVTGTNGKSSVAHFIAAALAEDAPCGLIGTLGSGLFGSLAPTGMTTPDAITLHGELAEQRAAGAAAVVMEVSSHALDQARVAGVAFDVAVFTNLTHDHLDYHGDLASYAAAKRRLFDLPGLGSAVLNVDDPIGQGWRAALTPTVPVIGFGMANGAELHASAITPVPTGLMLEFTWAGKSRRLESPLMGRFNAYNLLAALGALLSLGMPPEEAIDRLGRVGPVPGRMELFGGEGRPRVIVDYAHTPDALEQALRAAREHMESESRLWCVFGCGGDRDRAKRPLMGGVAEQFADSIVLTDDNPRGEDPFGIIEEIQHGMGNVDNSYVIRDRAGAIAHAIGCARDGDVVLVAGKGHETEQVIGERRLPFSDREVVLGVFERRGGGHG